VRAFSVDIARYVQINGTAIREGDIVSLEPDGYVLTDTPYDSRIQGVVVEKPEVSIRPVTQLKNSHAIVNSGYALVRVSASNGDIQRGDPVTTSLTAGVGVKATKPGYIIGNALENYKGGSGEVRTIRIALEPRYNEIRPSLLSYVYDAINVTLAAGYERPLTVFKYILASVIALLSIAAGFLYFGRIATKGVEALGRNPLAGPTIQFGIIMNIALSVLIIGVGVIIAIVILRL
jgi:hypothetical protein